MVLITTRAELTPATERGVGVAPAAKERAKKDRQGRGNQRGNNNVGSPVSKEDIPAGDEENDAAKLELSLLAQSHCVAHQSLQAS